MTVWTARYPKVFPRASDRRKAPFMGRSEVIFRQAWELGFAPIRAHIRSDAFVNQLGIPNALTMTVVVHGYLDAAGGQIQRECGVAIARTLILGAVNAEHNYGHRVQKATLPFGAARYLTAAKTLTMDMINNVINSQKNRVSDLVSSLFNQGKPPRAIADQVANVIGLSPRWATAVQNMYTRMTATTTLEDGTIVPLMPGMTTELALKRASQYSDKLLALRGEMVARTEMMRAMNAGRFEYWQDRVGRGDFDGNTIVKHWIVAPGACEECLMTADANAAGVPDSVVGLDVPFITPYGPVLYPPLHPHCRCTINYTPQFGSKKPPPPPPDLSLLTDLTDVDLSAMLDGI